MRNIYTFSKGVKRGYLVKRLHYCSSWLNVERQCFINPGLREK